MADIFVSYARQDKARVAPLVAALDRQGWSVWWDPAIVAGQEFDSLIRHEINTAFAVVVVWTPASVGSRWVRGEARLGAERGILVPVRFEHAELPIDAMAVHTTDLDEWREDSQSPPFQELLAALSRHLKDVARATPVAARRTSICVLPFANMSNDAEQEYFSDGITEDIITDLSKVSALTVIARNTAFTFKGQHVDIPQVARQLKVSHVLEGSVRKSGNRVRITGQLIDGITGAHLWAERYDRNLDDIFALQDEISRAIVAALKLRLLPEEQQALEARGTNNVEAYDIYLRAQDLSRQFGPEQTQRAIALYHRAVELDPRFALAWAGLGVACAGIVIRMPHLGKAAFAEMDTAFRQTTAIVPGTALGHAADGFRLMSHHDWRGADASYTAARAAGSARELSGLPGGSEYVFFLSNVGRFEEAVDAAIGNLAWDPLSLAVSATSQYVLDGAGRRADAEREYLRSLDLAGDRTTADYWALLRAWEGGPPELVAERTRQHLASSARLFAFYPELARMLDQPAAALALIRGAFGNPEYQDASHSSILAHWAAHFGDSELALTGLRRAFVEQRGLAVGNIWFPIQRATRRLSGFKDLVRELGLYNYWRWSGHWGDFVRASGAGDFEIIR